MGLNDNPFEVNVTVKRIFPKRLCNEKTKLNFFKSLLKETGNHFRLKVYHEKNTFETRSCLI